MINAAYCRKTCTGTLRLSLVLAFAGLFLSTLCFGDSVQKILAKEEDMRQKMLSISKDLGVTCSECHDVQNFKSAALPHFQTARDHMKVTENLKEQGFDGKHYPIATCFMCHQGRLKPTYNEALFKAFDKANKRSLDKSKEGALEKASEKASEKGKYGGESEKPPVEGVGKK